MFSYSILRFQIVIKKLIAFVLLYPLQKISKDNFIFLRLGVLTSLTNKFLPNCMYVVVKTNFLY